MTNWRKIGIWAAITLVAVGFVVWQLSRLSVDTSLDDWDQGFEGYLKASRAQIESGKPIALFFYTDWCSNCKELRETILSTPEVRQTMTQFHPVRINPELGSYENKLAEEYGVKGYPTVLIVDAKNDQSILIRRTANVTSKQFIDQVDEARRQLAS